MSLMRSLSRLAVALQAANWSPQCGICVTLLVTACRAGNSSGASLFYSIRASTGVSGPLKGRDLADSPPSVAASDEALLGQLEWVEAGVVSGWACVRGAPNQVLKVRQLGL